MKRLRTILFLISTLAFTQCDLAHASEDLLALVELNKATSESIALNSTVCDKLDFGEISSSNTSADGTVGEYSRLCGAKLYELEMTTNVLTTRITAGRNTFVWYIWNDADKAKGNIGKYGIIKDIHELTK